MITDRYTLYSFWANIVLTGIIFILAFSVIKRQDEGLTKLNTMYAEYNNKDKRHISCSEFKTYMEELDVEVNCGEH